MDREKQQELYEEKYESKLGMSYDQWLDGAPETEDEAYARCQVIDDELKSTHEQWQEAEGDEKEEMQEYREKLRLEYDMIEEMFGLELHDR